MMPPLNTPAQESDIESLVCICECALLLVMGMKRTFEDINGSNCPDTRSKRIVASISTSDVALNMPRRVFMTADEPFETNSASKVSKHQSSDLYVAVDILRPYSLAKNAKDHDLSSFDPTDVRTFTSFTYRTWTLYRDLMKKCREATMLPWRRPDVFHELASQPVIRGINYTFEVRHSCWEFIPSTRCEVLLCRMILLVDERLLAYTKLSVPKEADRLALYTPGMDGFLVTLDVWVGQVARRVRNLLGNEDSSSMFLERYHASEKRLLQSMASRLQESQESQEPPSEEDYQQFLILEMGNMCRSLDNMINAELSGKDDSPQRLALTPLPEFLCDTQEPVDESPMAQCSPNVPGDTRELLRTHLKQQCGDATPKPSDEELGHLSAMLGKNILTLYYDCERELDDFWRVYHYKLPRPFFKKSY